MAATAAMAAQLRLMVNEPTETTYDDDLIDNRIEAYPLLDALGTDPYEVDYDTEPPTLSERDEWIPTYDLNAAAAIIWEEKAAAVSDEFDFKADGGSYDRSQKYEQFMKNSRRYGSRRSAKTITSWVEPRELLSTEDI